MRCGRHHGIQGGATLVFARLEIFRLPSGLPGETPSRPQSYKTAGHRLCHPKGQQLASVGREAAVTAWRRAESRVGTESRPGRNTSRRGACGSRGDRQAGLRRGRNCACWQGPRRPLRCYWGMLRVTIGLVRLDRNTGRHMVPGCAVDPGGGCPGDAGRVYMSMPVGQSGE